MHYSDFTSTTSDGRQSSWILAYATVDVPLERSLAGITKSHPGATVFGCTSFQGVFTPNGFQRGIHAVAAAKTDNVRAAPFLRATGAARARADARAAAVEIKAEIGGPLGCILMHATPGFEEDILAGIDEAFNGNPPAVYGGSAADDAMKGEWKVFLGATVASEGFLLVGYASNKRILGSFVSGYTPSKTTGKVTAARGRVVQEIDNAPAAEVYNGWTHGAIRDHVAGGVVLHETVLSPLGRIVDKVGAMPRYLLSHPHQVLPGGALLFFSEMKVGDELTLMLGTESALVDRTSQATSRALVGLDPTDELAGGILIYCGGCVSVLGGKSEGAAKAFGRQLRGAPFVGASTFGEQGCFAGRVSANRHGNLMCDAVLFER